MPSNGYIPNLTNAVITTGTIKSISATDCSSKKYNVYLPAEFKEGFNTPSKQTTIDGIPLDEYVKHMTIDGIPFTDYVENIVDIRLRAILKEMKGSSK